MTRVVVVGSGVAGLTTALDLVAAAMSRLPRASNQERSSAVMVSVSVGPTAWPSTCVTGMCWA